MRDSIRRQLRITWHLPLVLGALAVIGAGTASWNWIRSSPPRVLRLSGTHREIGLQHGRLLRREIRDIWEGYIVEGVVAKEHRSVEELVATARHYDPFIPESLREEMHGIAEGAGVPYEQILVLNTFADALLGRQRLCSAVAARGEHGLLIGRNLDWTNYGIAHRTGIVFILEPTGERRVMSVAWPGMAGAVTGMNDRGLTASLNISFAGDLETNAMPSLQRLRDTLDRDSTVDDSVKRTIATPRTMAMNWMIGSPDRAVVVEMSGHRSAIREMENGCAVTTNYYESLPIQSGGVGSERSAVLRDRFTSHEATVRSLQLALLRVALISNSTGVNTIQSVVFDPTQKIAYVAIGSLPAPSGRFYRIAL